MKLLLIQASSNPGPSYSKKWAEKVVLRFQEKHADLQVETLDLAYTPVPHLTSKGIAASFTLPEQRDAEALKAIETSDQLVDQFLAADIIVFGIPMYNFSIPSVLKAYIDQIVRVGRTFRYTELGPIGLVSPQKRLFFITSSGAIYSQGPFQSADFLEPYVKTLFGFLGLRDFSFIRIEGTALGSAQIEESEALAVQKLEAYV